MVYIDTNVLIYASVEHDIVKQRKSLEILEKYANEGKLVLSTLTLQEFVFTMAKLKVDSDIIKKDSDFYMQYVSVEQDIFSLKKAIEICCDINYYKNINDVIHLQLAEKSKCKILLTFDSDFKKLEQYSDVVVQIL